MYFDNGVKGYKLDEHFLIVCFGKSIFSSLFYSWSISGVCCIYEGVIFSIYRERDVFQMGVIFYAALSVIFYTALSVIFYAALIALICRNFV